MSRLAHTHSLLTNHPSSESHESPLTRASLPESLGAGVRPATGMLTEAGCPPVPWMQVTKPEEVDRVVDYIRMNPVVEGIVGEPEAYGYSSAHEPGMFKLEER